MKRRRILSLWVAAAALTTASAIPVGAYFQADQASATGSAPAGTMQTVVLEALTGETPATALQPGSTGEVVLKVNNPNAFTIQLQFLSFRISFYFSSKFKNTQRTDMLPPLRCGTSSLPYSPINYSALIKN